jgi:hypothetical protein
VKSLFIISFILFCVSKNIYASSLQLGFGSLTPHFSDSKKNYCNQWNNTGIIANKTYYLRYLHGDYGLTYMIGNDSICSEIEGVFFHYLFVRTDYTETGITVGGYAFNEENWDEHAQKTPSGIDAPEPVQIDYFGREIVPVLALDFAVHLIRKERWSLKLNNLFTPIIFNHSLAFEYRF